MKKYFRTLTIAGSDSGGGAGIQADLKTFAALGCYGMSVITALTAQNTQGVNAIFAVEPEFIAEQFNAVMSDIGADVIKIGMLHRVGVINVVADCLAQYPEVPVVLDPVMVAKGGANLLQPKSVAALKQLLPRAHLITPNIPEAEILLQTEITYKQQMQAAAVELSRLYATNTLLKGGHLSAEDCQDCLCSMNGEINWFELKRIATQNTHGTGCTYSAAIAAGLAQGLDLIAAVSKAKQYLHGAIESGSRYKLGSGHGPVNHNNNQLATI